MADDVSALRANEKTPGKPRSALKLDLRRQNEDSRLTPVKTSSGAGPVPCGAPLQRLTRRRGGERAVLDALAGFQLAGKVLDPLPPTLDHHDLETVVMVQVHVL